MPIEVLIPALAPLAVVIVMVSTGLYFGFKGRRSYVGRERPSKVVFLNTELPVDAVRDRILALSEGDKYSLEEDKPEARLITLSTPPTGFSWGFYFPIYVEPRDGRPTQVTIGIESRFLQIGPVVTHHHRNCETAVRETLARTS